MNKELKLIFAGFKKAKNIFQPKRKPFERKTLQNTS